MYFSDRACFGRDKFLIDIAVDARLDNAAAKSHDRKSRYRYTSFEKPDR